MVQNKKNGSLMLSSHKISVVTTSFNCKKFIGQCLESVRWQNWDLFQHIVVDGGSTDGSYELVCSKICKGGVVFSEKDEGIYDAMNKGVRFSSGGVVGTLNADDLYPNENVLSRVLYVFERQGVESCYGDIVYVDPEDTNKVLRYWRAGEFHPRKFYWGWMPPHPTFFVRREIYEKYGLYRLDMGTAADYELMLRFLLKHRISVAYIPKVLVKMRAGGASNRSWKARWEAHKFDRKAWEVNGLKPYPWTLLFKVLRKIPQYFMKPPKDAYP